MKKRLKILKKDSIHSYYPSSDVLCVKLGGGGLERGGREREQHGSGTLRGESSFTAGRASTFYRNPELEMREKEDYCSLQVTYCCIHTIKKKEVEEKKKYIQNVSRASVKTLESSCRGCMW